jgi:hypothetical protein
VFCANAIGTRVARGSTRYSGLIVGICRVTVVSSGSTELAWIRGDMDAPTVSGIDVEV